MKIASNSIRRLTFGALVLIFLQSCSHKPVDDYDNDPLLTNTNWFLQKMFNETVLPGSVMLYFDHETNRLSGFTGCNKLTGSFLIRPDRIVLSPAAATRFICFGKGTVEKDFLECLVTTDSLIIETDTLKLFSEKLMLAVFSKK